MPYVYRPRDEDEWSDDEPDALLRGKDHLINSYSAQRNDDEYNEEDSLMNDRERQEDGYGDLDDEMEMELFGKIQRSPAVPAQRNKVTTGAGASGIPVPQRPPGKPFQSPAGQATAGRTGKRGKGGDVDDAASDCSDLTIDSMLHGGAKKSQATPGNANKGSAVKAPPARSQAAAKVPTVDNLQRANPAAAPVWATQPAAPPQPQALYHSSLPPAYNYAAVQQHAQQPAPAQPQVVVQFASAHKTPAAPEKQHSSADSGSTPSPTRSKGKPVYRKLKPIPISQPYRPVPNPTSVHE